MNAFALEGWAYPKVEAAAQSGKWVVLLPTGSTEPHGPHMGLGVDTAISIGAAQNACERLQKAGFVPSIAPALPYGVTECASAFAGALSVSPELLIALLGELVDGWLAQGAAHVCLVNNHLEPDHDQAIRKVASSRDSSKVTVACPLERRWGRTLSDEYKSGQCHAGQYETSIILACAEHLVDKATMQTLGAVPISLAEQLMSGVKDFKSMGLSHAYAGTPKEASAEEGRELLNKLGTMVFQTVHEALESTNV